MMTIARQSSHLAHKVYSCTARRYRKLAPGTIPCALLITFAYSVILIDNIEPLNSERSIQRRRRIYRKIAEKLPFLSWLHTPQAALLDQT